MLLENENKARERGLRGPVAGSGFRFPSQRRAPRQEVNQELRPERPWEEHSREC